MHRPAVKFAGRKFHLPGSRIIRMVIGFALVCGGVLGFLPILGFWMVPIGLLVLSVDIPIVRRWRRKFQIWWARRRERRRGVET
jgi:hypothetical protein